MPFFLVCALKDVKRRLLDPVAIATWLGIPLVIGLLLGLVMGGDGGVTPKAKLFLVDLDDSFVSHFLVGAAGNGGGNSMIDPVLVDLEEGRRRIDAGEGSALLVIPAGFESALLEEAPIELVLVTNPAQRILPGILEEGLEILVEAAFYAQRMFGEQLSVLAKGPASSSDFFASAVIAAEAASMNDSLQALDGTLFPPLLDLEIEVIEKEKAAPQNSGLLLFPGMLLLTMLFIAQGMSSDIWEEKAAGTLRRMLSTPQGIVSWLLGKVLAAGFVVCGVTALGLTAGVLIFGFPLGGLLPALLWGTFSGTVLAMVFFLLQSLGSNQQAASVLTSMALFPLMMLGGSLFPMEAMPAWMLNIGRWTPNGMALVQFKSLLMESADLQHLGMNFLMLSVLAAVCFALTVRRASGKFTQE
jgi:ABC-type multidrug transport system permease subunit